MGRNLRAVPSRFHGGGWRVSQCFREQHPSDGGSDARNGFDSAASIHVERDHLGCGIRDSGLALNEETMFVQSSAACSMPNSESPMSQQDIDDQNAFIASVGTAFDAGDDAINSLIQSLGGNPAGDTISGASGVPTTGTLDTSTAGIPVVPTNSVPVAMLPSITNPASWAWAPSPAPPILLPGGGSGYRAQHGETWNANRRRYRNASQPPQQQSNVPGNCPVIVPLVTTIPIPSVSVPSAAPPVVTTPSAATPAPSAPLPDCRTGNWCLDIMNGCVLSSQVSAQQLQACAVAGYAGNRNLYPAVAAAGGAGGGQYFGTPDPNPTPYSAGMSGLGQDASSAQASNAGIFSSSIEYVISGVVAAVVLGIMLKGRKKS